MNLTDTQLFVVCLSVLLLFTVGFSFAAYYRRTEDDKRKVISN